MSIVSESIPKDNGSIEQKQTKAKDLPWWLGPEVIDEVKEEEVDESQKESDKTPLKPVTFRFVGIRPSKAHEQNHQISTISLTKTHSISAVQIPFKSLTVNDNVETLKSLLFEEFAIPKSRKSLLIYYGDTKLAQDTQLLKHYGVTDHSTFLVALYDNASTNHCDNGANAPETKQLTEDELSRKERERSRRQRDLDRAQQRLQRINDLRNGIAPSVTKTNKKRKPKEIVLLRHLLQKYKSIEMVQGFDIISQESDVECIPLPVCGHLLARDSLYDYAASQLVNREQSLKCPHTGCDNNKLCGTQWAYPLIKQCLSIHDAEDHEHKTQELDYSKLELLLSRNIMEMRYDVQKCSQCKSLLYRNPKDHNFDCRTECPLCTSSVFCWGCSETWSDDHECDTSFRAATMEILSKCPFKSVGPASKCPSVRACPKCNQLIQHVSACKHMKCSFCKTNFCFICLKPQVNNSWKCGSYTDRCPTHKRQNYTLLPKLNQTTFSVF
eukprot:167312_1